MNAHKNGCSEYRNPLLTEHIKYTVHNTAGDNLGQMPDELVSLHMTQESANAAMETATSLPIT